MMNNCDATIHMAPREAAAYWFTRMRSADLTDTEYTTFEQWFRADPVHRQEYRLLERVWSMAGELTDDDCARLTEAPQHQRSAFLTMGRRYMAVGMGLACMLFAAIGVSHWVTSEPDDCYVTELSAHTGVCDDLACHTAGVQKEAERYGKS